MSAKLFIDSVSHYQKRTNVMLALLVYVVFSVDDLLADGLHVASILCVDETCGSWSTSFIISLF